MIFAKRSWSGSENIKGLALTVPLGTRIIIGPPDNPIGVVSLAAITGDGDALPKAKLVFDFPRHIEISRDRNGRPIGYAQDNGGAK